MKGQTTPMRIDTRTRKVINKIAAEYQFKTGKNWSANDALWQFLKEHRPDLIDEADDKPMGKPRKAKEEDGEE